MSSAADGTREEILMPKPPRKQVSMKKILGYELADPDPWRPIFWLMSGVVSLGALLSCLHYSCDEPVEMQDSNWAAIDQQAAFLHGEVLEHECLKSGAQPHFCRQHFHMVPHE